jgi:peptidoglycan/LPS O-acetylase OafA/YrhL
VDDKANRLVALDGWRAISALIVVVWHLQHNSSLAGPLSGLPGLNGTVGVELFFGISGFVIGRSLLAERAATGQIGLGGFYVRRLFRIVPPLLLYVAVVELLTRFGLLEAAAKGAINALTFRCNLIAPACGGYVGGHTWSLSVEEQFYLVIPLVLAMVGARSRAALTGMLLAFPILVVGLYVAKQVDAADILSEFMTIGLGVACALNEDRVRRIVTSLPGWTVLPALAATFLLRGLEPQGTRTIIEVLLVPPLVMYVLLGSTFRHTILSGLLACRPIQALGAASYSLYLWQQLATYPFPGVGPWFYAASLSACVLVAFASRSWLEKPAIRFGAELSRRLRQRRVSRPAETLG